MAAEIFDGATLESKKCKNKLKLAALSSEAIKNNVATVFPGSRNEEMEIRGRDMVSGLPRTVTIYSEEIEEALRESVTLITAAAKDVLEKTPPELSADIIDRGVILTGGGALIH